MEPAPSNDLPLFRPDISQVGVGSCERYALSPVAAVSRWSLLLLSPLLSAAISRAGRPGVTGWACAGRLAGGGASLIRRREVGVPVHELPVAVDAPVDMGDPDHHVARRAAVDADVAALEADRVGEVSAGGDDGMLHVHGIGAGEAAADPAHGVGHGLVPLLDGSPRAEEGYVIGVRPGVDHGAGIAVLHGCTGGGHLFQCLGKRIVSHEPALPPLVVTRPAWKACRQPCDSYEARPGGSDTTLVRAMKPLMR